MRVATRVLLSGALVIFALASCATVPVAQRPDRVESLVTELNTAAPERLMELTGRPFLLDGEILVRAEDVRTMWQNLRDAGFAFDGATIVDLGPATGADTSAFGSTMDVRVWFERYAGEEAGLARIATSHGDFLIVTGGRVGRSPMFLGFTEAD